MSQLKTEKVILLKRVKYGESDLILHGINASGAKVHLFARAALKSKKRFGGGVLEPLNCIQAVYRETEREGSEPLYQLQEASLIHGFPKLRSDYERLELAFYFIKSISHAAQMGTVDGEPLFNLLGNAMKAAETTSNLLHLKLHFEVKLLAIQGVLPQIPSRDVFMNSSVTASENLTLPNPEDWVSVQKEVALAMSQLP